MFTELRFSLRECLFGVIGYGAMRKTNRKDIYSADHAALHKTLGITIFKT